MEQLLTTEICKIAGGICFQEAWLNTEIADQLICPPQFVCHRLDREKNKKMHGGGVAIFVHRTWCSTS